MTERDQSFAGATASGPPTDTTTPVYSAEPVAARGPDSLGGLLLILAGIAAAISLVLDWVDGEDTTALDLVREGFEDLGGIVDNGLWQPMAVVLGGGVLLVLGILMWLPARSHRFLACWGSSSADWSPGRCSCRCTRPTGSLRSSAPASGARWRSPSWGCSAASRPWPPARSTASR